jgi:hypothetical protein
MKESESLNQKNISTNYFFHNQNSKTTQFLFLREIKKFYIKKNMCYNLPNGGKYEKNCF